MVSFSIYNTYLALYYSINNINTISMKLKNFIYTIATYTIMGLFSLFMAIAFIATLCGDGNKGLFELF